MLLGLSSPLAHESPQQWAAQMKALGCGSVVFPLDYTAPDSLIAEYADATERQGLVIAEVGIWRNVLAADLHERRAARERAIGQLRLADELGAKCCVNVAGTMAAARWDGGCRENFSQKTWDETVLAIQHIIDTVRPQRTKFTIEPMPWMFPSGPDEYLALVQAVDREAFAVHLDLVNMVNTPRRYFFLDEFMEECLAKLGPYTSSCHLKDVYLREEYTFQLVETACGQGTLNLEKYIRLINQVDPQMPVIIEHLDTDREYLDSLAYVQARLRAADLLP